MEKFRIHSSINWTPIVHQALKTWLHPCSTIHYSRGRFSQQKNEELRGEKEDDVKAGNTLEERVLTYQWIISTQRLGKETEVGSQITVLTENISLDYTWDGSWLFDRRDL